LSLTDIIRSARSHARFLAICGGAVAVLTAIVWLVLPRSYLADAAFVAQGSSNAAGISALAAQLGVAVPSGDASESPAFYVELLQSRAVLDSVVATPYRIDGKPAESLADILRISGSPDRRQELAMEAVRHATTVDQSRNSNIVTIQVRTRWHDLSLELVSRMLQSLNQFNLHSRQSRASAQRRFIEARTAEAKAQLDSTDAALSAFAQENRAYTGSPQLVLEHDRLVRAAGLRQNLYANLATSLDQARIDELRDTPVITVVDGPGGSVAPEPRGLAKKTILGFLVGVLLGAIVIAGRGTWRATKPGSAGL